MQNLLLTYHIVEELLIFLLCFIITTRAYKTSQSPIRAADPEISSRLFLVSGAFAILGISSLIHASIHALDLSINLLYQTLVGYCLGLLILILAISAERTSNKKMVPLLYFPLVILFLPTIHEKFPLFNTFRPLVWVSVAYLSGVVCMLYIATFYHTKLKRFLYSAGGHILICISAIFLFFPAPIGSSMWLYGHIFRPIGFGILFFSMSQEEMTRMGGSILYRALTAFSLLAAIPLLIFGTVIFYDNIAPINILGQRLLIFLLLLATLASALVFGLGLIIRLIRPVLQLKESVAHLGDQGLDHKIEVTTHDEIGELSNAYNDMIWRLGNAIEEQERYCRLAATGELAATLAHEIRNPLNAIDGAATYIGKNFQGSLITEFVKIISDEVGRINKLTTALLSFSKPIQHEPEPQDINIMVAETVRLLEQEAKEQNITIVADLSANLPLLSFDYNQLKQVLINLLINAFDATEEGGKIVVHTKPATGMIHLAVQDFGKGIAPENIKKIFNPFFTTKTRGTGLGLAISKRIAQEHNGDLIVESIPGQGTIFTLMLRSKS